MSGVSTVRAVDRRRALWRSTIAFTVCFALWTIASCLSCTAVARWFYARPGGMLRDTERRLMPTSQPAE
jgi:hypothetical protein